MAPSGPDHAEGPGPPASPPGDGALELATRLAGLERDVAAAHALVEAGRELAGTLDVDAAVSRVMVAVLKLFGVRRAVLYRLEPDGSLVCRAAAGAGDPDAWIGRRLPPGAGVAGRAVAEGRALWVADITQAHGLVLPSWAGDRAATEGYRVVAAAPLRARGDTLGALALGDSLGRTFTDSDLSLLGAFADQASLALQNARLYAEAERRRQNAESLAELGRLVSGSLDPGEVAPQIASSVRRLLRCQNAMVFRVEPGSGDLELVARAGVLAPVMEGRTRFPAGSGVAGLAVREGRPVFTSDLMQDPRVSLPEDVVARVHGLDFRAVLAVPLHVADRILGALAVGDRSGREFTAEDVWLAQAFADQAGTALENARLHAEARERLTFLRSITENSADAIMTTDPRGLFTYWSPGAVEMIGYPPEEILGRPLADFLPGGRDETRHFAERLQREERVRGHETRFRTQSGALIDVSVSVSLLRGPGGEPAGALGVARDVTERKRLEADLRQVQKLEALGRLAGGVAHDFNNLLAVILGYGEMLVGALERGSPGHVAADEIRRAAERGAGLTRQLLAFGRRQVLQPRPLDFNLVVEGMAPMLRRLVGEDVEVATRLWPTALPLLADPGQLEQILLNLAANARDAMPRGGRLTISTEPVAGAEPRVRLAVRDTGVGMEEAVRTRVFEPFFTTKEGQRGTGLGLATVYGIVQQHQGTITVESTPGAGSVFVVELPGLEQLGGPEGGAPAPAPAPGGAETVLVVEDEPAVRRMTRDILVRQGYTVLEAGSGEEALRLVEARPEPIHLLLADVIMPGLSGPAVAERLLSRQPAMAVLYMSGYTDDLLDAHGLRRAAGGILEKPFTPATLVRRVRAALDRAEP